MRRTPYRIIIHQNVSINSNYMEKLGSTIVSYISEIEYLSQKRSNPLFFTCPYTGASGSIDKLWLEHGYLASKEDFLGKIYTAIDNHVVNTFNYPSILLIHPETFEKVFTGFHLEHGNKNMKDIFLKNVKIIRTLDIDPGNIKVY